MEKLLENAIILAKLGHRWRIIVKKFTIILFFIILCLSIPSYADFKISGSNGDLILSDEEIKDMPKEAFIEVVYKVNQKGKIRDVAVKGLSLRYLLLERVGVDIADGDVILLKAKSAPILTVTYKDLMNSYARFVIATEIDGNPVIDTSEGYTIFSRHLYSSQDSIFYEGILGLKFGPEINLSKPSEYSYFSDIGEEYRYASSAINYLYQKGIISGVGSGKFAPGKNITRAEMSKIANLIVGTDKVDYKGNFRDVRHTDWFAPYVAQSVKKGFFEGYEDGSFRPYKNITRQEFSAVVARLALEQGLVTKKEMQAHKITKQIYSDAFSIARYVRSEVAWLEAKGALGEIARDKFEPNKPITRAEACRVLYVALFK